MTKALKARLQPATPPVRELQFISCALQDKLEGLSAGAAPKLAVLILLSETMRQAEYSGHEAELEQLAWFGIADLLRDVLRDVEELQRTSGFNDGPFAMLADADAKDGAR